MHTYHICIFAHRETDTAHKYVQIHIYIPMYAYKTHMHTYTNVVVNHKSCILKMQHLFGKYLISVLLHLFPVLCNAHWSTDFS